MNWLLATDLIGGTTPPESLTRQPEDLFNATSVTVIFVSILMILLSILPIILIKISSLKSKDKFNKDDEQDKK
ncbi:MAG: hypothetical protein IJ488_01575 [Clostridia bacterium]|nr:hypothetical protein [Clostridia bacterium]